MTSLSRFGRRKIRELAETAISDDHAGFKGSLRLKIPIADQEGGVLERDDQFVSGSFRSRFEHISRYSRVHKERWGTIADIGCGTGYGTSLLSEGRRAVGVDVSQAAIRYAMTTYSNSEFIRGDAGAIPLKNNGFDAVTAFEVIEHLPEPEMLLEECHRILKQGGTLFLSSPNPAHIGNILRKTFFRMPIPPKVELNNKYHIKEFSHDELLSVISSHGYRLEWCVGQTLPLDQFIPGIGYVIRRTLELLHLSDVYDWIFSVMGRKFPRLSWTIVYAARRI